MKNTQAAIQLGKKSLDIDPAAEAARIQEFIRAQVTAMRRKGAVIGLSGGIDSAVVSALCVRALGPERVLGLLLPERESNPVSEPYGRAHAERLGIRCERVDITPALEVLGAYRHRTAAIKEAYAEYEPGMRFNTSLPQDLLDRDRINYRLINFDTPQGLVSRRLTPAQWQQILACQNIKQRVRMISLFYEAERLNYLVGGTTNKSELAQGWYVKFGDGGVDIEPIAHLYKMQVYQVAEYLGVSEDIRRREPSPDTYSLPVSDQELYFCLPFETADLVMYGQELGLGAAAIAQAAGLNEEQAERVMRDMEAKMKATWHLRELPPSLS